MPLPLEIWSFDNVRTGESLAFGIQGASGNEQPIIELSADQSFNDQYAPESDQLSGGRRIKKFADEGEEVVISQEELASFQKDFWHRLTIKRRNTIVDQRSDNEPVASVGMSEVQLPVFIRKTAGWPRECCSNRLMN